MIDKKIKFYSDMRYSGEGLVIDKFIKDGDTKYLVEISNINGKEYEPGDVISIWPSEVMRLLKS